MASALAMNDNNHVASAFLLQVGSKSLSMVNRFDEVGNQFRLYEDQLLQMKEYVGSGSESDNNK